VFAETHRVLERINARTEPVPILAAQYLIRHPTIRDETTGIDLFDSNNRHLALVARHEATTTLRIGDTIQAHARRDFIERDASHFFVTFRPHSNVV
jgi:hypothetical protein